MTDAVLTITYQGWKSSVSVFCQEFCVDFSEEIAGIAIKVSYKGKKSHVLVLTESDKIDTLGD